MAEIHERATVEVQVNGEQAKNELQSLEKYATSLKDRIADAYSAGDTKKIKELEKELKKTNSQLRTMRTNAVNINEVMQNLSTAGPKELQKTLKAINKELESGRIKRGTQEWNEYQAKLKLVNAEIKKIKAEGVETESFLSRMNGKLSKWGGMIAGAAAALTGLTLAFSKMRKDSMGKEESQDNLKALTGLDDDSIAWLTQQAEILSTTMDKSGLRVKQSSQDILDAYTLVGSAKPELLSNKEALNAVTIETMRLSTAAKMDLKEAVDAVTLSMNQYGASADEAAKYTNVMAAGSKVGAVAVQSITAAIVKSGVSASGADVSIEQLVGSIETLGEKGIKDEVAGTGLKTFFLRLQTGADDTNPKVVGLQTALKNLQKLSTQDILSRFGQEAYTVAQTLITGADKVDYYTKVVTGTNVATEQAAINSDNAAAKVAQMKNKLQEAGIELMEKLNPSVNLLGTYFTNMIKILPPVIDFLQKYGKVIVYGTIVVLSYIAAVKLQHFWLTKVKTATGEYIVIQKLKSSWDKIGTASQTLHSAAIYVFSGNIKMAKEAMLAFFRVLKVHPLGIIIAALAALAYGIYKFCTYTTEADKAVKDFSGRNVELQRELRKTYTALIGAKDGTQARKDMIKEFNDKYGGYLTNLLSEESTLQDIKKAYNEVTVAMQRKLAGQVLQEKTEEIERGNLDKKADTIAKIQEILSKGLTDSQLQKVMPKIVSHVDEYIQQGKSIKSVTKSIISGLSKEYDQLNFKMKDGNWGFDLIEEANGELEDYVEMVKNGADEVEKVKNKLKPFLSEPKEKPNNVLEDVVITPDKKTATTTPTLDDEAIKAAIQKLDADFAKVKAEQAALYSIGKMTKQEFDSFVLDSEAKLLDDKMKLYSKESKEYNDLLQRKYQMQIKQNQECQKEDLQTIDDRTKAAKRQLLDSYLDQHIDKKAYEEGLLQIDREAIVRKQNLYADGSREFNDHQKQLEDFDAQDKLKRQQAYEEKIKQFRQEYQKKTTDELMQDEIKAWDIFHEKGALKEEEYQKIIAAIKEKYAIQKGQSEVGYGYNDAKYGEEIGQLVDQAKAQAGNAGNPETDSIWDSMFGNDAKLHAGILDNLKTMEEQGLISHKDYLTAKSMADAEYYNELERKASIVYGQISAIMSSYSSYVSACQDVETSQIEKKYEKEIAAAGNNSTKVAKLEDNKEKEIAKVKTKYNKKNTTIQIAKAVAETAMGALKAYNAAWELGPVGAVLGPIFAGMAIVSGMLQVATIKKQAQAQESGYYQGGFTGDGVWDEEKGTVHAGEFVANRFAVRNKEILPVLRLIDNAQKNNTIGSLRATDVSNVLHAGVSKSIVSGDSAGGAGTAGEMNMELVAASMNRTAQVIEQLQQTIDNGLEAVVTIDGERGLDSQYAHYKKLKSNKDR